MSDEVSQSPAAAPVDVNKTILSMSRQHLLETALSSWMEGFYAAAGREHGSPLSGPEVRERDGFMSRFVSFLDRASTQAPPA